MKRLHSLTMALLLSCTAAMAQHTPQQLAEDAMRHQALGAAMQALSACYAQGAQRDACIAQTKTECTGLAIGKNCGLRDEAMANAARSYAQAARANQQAAQCLNSGKDHDDCEAELAKACKGIGVGKYCGMVHAHTF